ncbi:MAG: glycosyltransferase family 4 protein [Acidobacteria bacterium]|nr:glycosyltransferase family 4 protein [Acidobacteriota bacterium]MCA1649580.1 glycosyltransferase family 4 protein [Acidobacteriota bacterium]
MKVLVLSTVFPNPQQPLHGLFVRERIRHLARYAEIRVVSPVPWFNGGARIPASEQQGNLEVRHPTFYYIPAVFKVLDGLFLFLSTLPEVRRIRQSFKFDLVDAHFAYPDGFAGILLGRWFRVPVVITVRGSELHFVRHPLRRMAIKWALRRADRVIAVSTALGDLARDFGTGPQRLDVIRNGVDPERFSPRPARDARLKLGLLSDAPLLVAVGHLVPLKGFHRVIEAFHHLLQEFPDAKLAIVGGHGSGTGRYPQQLAQLIDKLGLSGQVLMPGPQAPDRVAVWLNAADVLVLDSDREGCPNVVCEAMACGCPVVAPRVGEIENMVPTHAGILFDDPNDVPELTRCLAETLKRKWDGQGIRATAVQNTWDCVAQQVLRAWGAAAPVDRNSTAMKAEVTEL